MTPGTLILIVVVVYLGGFILDLLYIRPNGCSIPEDCQLCITEPCQSREDFPLNGPGDECPKKNA